MNPEVKKKPSRKLVVAIAAVLLVGVLATLGFIFLPKIIAKNKQLAEEAAEEKAYLAETAEVDAINEAFVSGKPFDHTEAVNTLRTFIIDHLDRPNYIYEPLDTLVGIYYFDRNFAEAEQYVNYVAMKTNSATAKIEILRALERFYVVDGNYSALVELYTQIVDLALRSDLTPEERAEDEKRLEEYKSRV